MDAPRMHNRMGKGARGQGTEWQEVGEHPGRLLVTGTLDYQIIQSG